MLSYKHPDYIPIICSLTRRTSFEINLLLEGRQMKMSRNK